MNKAKWLSIVSPAPPRLHGALPIRPCSKRDPVPRHSRPRGCDVMAGKRGVRNVAAGCQSGVGTQGNEVAMRNPVAIDRRCSKASMIVALGMAVTVMSSPLLAQQYTWSTGPENVSAIPGVPMPPVPRRTFLDVYCVDFPRDMPADSVSEGLLNGNAISFYRVVYQTGMMGYVITSMLPKGRSDAEDYALLLAQERRSEQAVNAASTKDRYRVSTSHSAWGDVIDVRIINILDKNADGPFPLTRPILGDADAPPHSMSVHRLFARGTNRFEIAVMGVPKDPKAKDSQRMLEEDLTAFADKLVASLQTCTTRMSSDGPGRTPR